MSVVIRTMVLEGNRELIITLFTLKEIRWLIKAELSLGAGGAITWLSDPLGEWDEVLTKVKSVVGTLKEPSS